MIASVDGNLTINCNSNGSLLPTPAKLSISGVTQTNSLDLKLWMDADNVAAPATIRGSIVHLVPACNTTGAISFTDTEVNAGTIPVAEIESLAVGSNQIPYRFSLCAFPSQGVNKFGSASAQATITLDWE